jgi:hypothetical protein
LNSSLAQDGLLSGIGREFKHKIDELCSISLSNGFYAGHTGFQRRANSRKGELCIPEGARAASFPPRSEQTSGYQAFPLQQDFGLACFPVAM